MMKRVLLLVVSLAALVSCQQPLPVADAPSQEDTGAIATRPQGYVALPGRAATSTTPSETNTALEFAAASFNTSVTPAAPAAQQPQTAPPAPLPNPAAPVWRQMTSAPGAPYAVQITNGTSGRIFVEAQDAGDNIFPFGFMHAGQRLGALPQDPRPIQGELILIVRDPDRRGAPELRRYHITPPPNYEGKTIGITILPGGRYRASLDGQIYYVSPEPQQQPAANTPSA